MSTGSGKSAIYEIAALIKPGPTVVVSPLISLQRDQVEAIDDELPGEAAELNAAATERQRAERLRALRQDDLEFLFLAPEQLARPETVEALRAAEPSLLVVDEAHCISEWGHDFRPDYLRLGGLVEELGHPTVIALTATASPPIREEIVERLRMEEPAVIVRGFDRPNIWLGVHTFREEAHKREALVERVLGGPRPGIVYAATRRVADELATELGEGGLRAAAYHAGMARKRRDEIQERFMDDELDVVVATTAFGMGVDKPNVRFVLHHAVSDSIDSYSQEIGRGGRDDEPAEALLFWRPEDLALRRFFAGGQLDGETLETVVHAVREHRGDVPAGKLQKETELSETKLMAALSRLEDVGAVQISADGRVRAGGDRSRSPEDLVELAVKEEEDRHRFDGSRLEMMRAYAEHEHCRRSFLLSYFGEEHARACGNCDNCDAGHGEPDDSPDVPFEVGARVVHGEWGEGVVQRYDGDRIVVLFDAAGYKTMSVELISARGLLDPA